MFSIKVIDPIDAKYYFNEYEIIPIFASPEYVDYLLSIGKKVSYHAVFCKNYIISILCVVIDHKRLTCEIRGPFWSKQEGYSFEEMETIFLLLTKKLAILKFYRVSFDYDCMNCHSMNALIWNNVSEKYGFIDVAKYTLLIDLKNDEDVLYSSFKRNLRKTLVAVSTNYPELKFVKLENNDNDAVRFFDIVNENKKRNKLPIYDIKKVYRKTETFEMFAIFQGDKILSVLGAYKFGKYVIEAGIGTSEYAYKMSINTGDLLKWEMIKHFKQNGFLYFDLAGVNPNSTDEKERGIYQYKAKWSDNCIAFSSLQRVPQWFIALLNIRKWTYSLLRKEK